MYTDLCRIYMIPAAPTAGGLDWARGRFDSLHRLSTHLAECTKVVPETQQSHLMGVTPDGTQLSPLFRTRQDNQRVDGLRFFLDPDRIKDSVLRQSRQTERGGGKKIQKNFSVEERQFFDLIDELTGLVFDEIKQLRDTQDEPFYRSYGWALLSGAEVAFLGGTSIPQFFGLHALEVLRAAVLSDGEALPKDVSFENADVDEQLGAGVVTALKVYMGREKLGAQRTDLIPHRLHGISTANDGHATHILRIGQLDINPT